MRILSLSLRSIQRRGIRSLLLIGVVLIVSAAVALLLSAVETSKVTVDQDLAKYWRSTYDILVRPPGHRSPIEEKYGLVQANHLSGIHGGISFDQYEAIREMPEVEVAAPVAMLIYVDVLSWEGGLRSKGLSFPGPGYYFTQTTLSASGSLLSYEKSKRDYYYIYSEDDLASRTEEEVQELEEIGGIQAMGLHWLAGSRGYHESYRFPVLLAAIDPEQEAKLVYLENAVVGGRYFREVDTPEEHRGQNADDSYYRIPILMNTTDYANLGVQVELWKIDLPMQDMQLQDIIAKGGMNYLAGLPAEKIDEVISNHIDSFEVLKSMNLDLHQPWGMPPLDLGLIRRMYWPASVEYVEIESPMPEDGLALRALPRGLIPCHPPYEECSTQVQFREVDRVLLGSPVPPILGETIGVFDATSITKLKTNLGYVPLETYAPPNVRLILDDEGEPVEPPAAISPMLEPEGYIQYPPVFLTTMAVAKLYDPVDPISAIRVRVRGINAFNPETQAKIEAVAGIILDQTGLDVDVVVGSSPRKILVHIPGYGGAPSLGYAEELWIEKGVTLSYAREVERINLVFFGLILSVCTLNVLNTGLMTAVGRQKETAMLKALGWRSSTVSQMALLEMGLLGAVAGGIGAVLAWGIAQGLRLELPVGRAALIVPLGVALCLLGGLIPAMIAARIPPAVTLREGELHQGKRPYGLRFSMMRYSLHTIMRRRPRTLLVMATMALSGALLTTFLAAALNLRGYLSGTLLGEYLLVRIESHHYLMASVSLLVAATTVADALLVSALERRREIGVLKAIGWRSSDVFVLFLTEGGLMSLSGGVAGVLMGSSSMLALTRSAPGDLGIAYLLGLIVPVAAGLLAAIPPGIMASRIPVAEAVRYE